MALGEELVANLKIYSINLVGNLTYPLSMDCQKRPMSSSVFLPSEDDILCLCLRLAGAM